MLATGICTAFFSISSFGISLDGNISLRHSQIIRFIVSACLGMRIKIVVLVRRIAVLIRPVIRLWDIAVAISICVWISVHGITSAVSMCCWKRKYNCCRGGDIVSG